MSEPYVYCPECDEQMEPWTPTPDGSLRWVCDRHGVWSDRAWSCPNGCDAPYAIRCSVCNTLVEWPA